MTAGPVPGAHSSDHPVSRYCESNALQTISPSGYGHLISVLRGSTRLYVPSQLLRPAPCKTRQQRQIARPGVVILLELLETPHAKPLVGQTERLDPFRTTGD